MELILALAIFSAFLIVYHHALYPILLKLIATRCQTEVEHQPLADEDYPSIHLILPAYNEADVVADKIRNVAQLSYPSKLLKVTLVGDGCQDNTMAVARQTLDELGTLPFEFVLDEHQVNRGKIAVLNQAIGDSQGDIIALSDISALINDDALLIAAQRFRDQQIGVVNSSYQFVNYSSEGEKAYWRYQSQVKKMETDTGSVIGAHGALYFFRRHLFTPLPADTINDDFILPMRIVEQGYKAVHDESIVALELECVKTDANNNRRMRIAAGNLQQAIRLRGLIRPKFKGVAFNFLSGKVLRVCMPFLLVVFYLASIILALESKVFIFIAAIQTFIYTLALYLHITRAQGETNQFQGKIFAVIYYLVSGYWFSFVGMTQYLAKSRKFKV